VEDVDAAAKMTEELGGKVLLAPTDVPGFGRAAVLRDPQGAAFGVFTPVSGKNP
jgi:predicted enzyme related to lactoylglutathione lyase